MQSDCHIEKNERRTGADRRATDVNFGFPFIDSHGNLVTEDRRIINRRTQESNNTDQPNEITSQKEYARQTA